MAAAHARLVVIGTLTDLCTAVCYEQANKVQVIQPFLVWSASHKIKSSPQSVRVGEEVPGHISRRHMR